MKNAYRKPMRKAASRKKAEIESEKYLVHDDCGDLEGRTLDVTCYNDGTWGAKMYDVNGRPTTYSVSGFSSKEDLIYMFEEMHRPTCTLERIARKTAGIEDEFPGFEVGTDFYDPRTDYFFTVDRFEDGMLVAFNDLFMFYGWTPDVFREMVTEPNMRNFGSVYGPEEPNRWASAKSVAGKSASSLSDMKRSSDGTEYTGVAHIDGETLDVIVYMLSDDMWSWEAYDDLGGEIESCYFFGSAGEALANFDDVFGVNGDGHEWWEEIPW